MPAHIDYGYVLITTIALVTLYFIYDEATDKRVRIGLTPMVDPAYQHGIAWIENPDGLGIVKYGFVVDKPAHLADPTHDTIRDMFNQLEKMDIKPHFLEIRIGNVVRTYKPGERRPLMVEPREAV